MDKTLACGAGDLGSIPGGDTNKKKKVLAFFFVSVDLKTGIELGW
jgi:hypothetical protein